MNIEQSSAALWQELEHNETADYRRLQIGKWLEQMGDQRSGVSVKNGLPDIEWLPIVAAGMVKITRFWLPDTPDEEAKVIPMGNFKVVPFYIAKYLVTYVQYQSFVEAEDGYDNAAWWQGMPEAYQRQELAEQRTKLDNHPRDSLSWYQSIAFARWLNDRMQGFELPQLSGEGMMRVGDNAQVRLPTEWEWQWAAQNGAEARLYPWAKANNRYANTIESGLKQTTAVGMYPHGAAACGALDMAGNLMEWCLNDKIDLEVRGVTSSAAKALRGGDWGYGVENAICAYCDDEVPSRIDPLNGFRLIIGRKL